MCQEVRGPKVVFEKPKRMWKVIRNQRLFSSKGAACAGPYHVTRFRPDGWSYSALPRQTRRPYSVTRAGYHVFVSKTGAEAYANSRPRVYSVIPVHVKGKAIPFTYERNDWAAQTSNRYKGYAVQYWRKA